MIEDRADDGEFGELAGLADDDLSVLQNPPRPGQRRHLVVVTVIVNIDGVVTTLPPVDMTTAGDPRRAALACVGVASREAQAHIEDEMGFAGDTDDDGGMPC